jgi:uncharacterized phiE125 gp8 family phage protein
LEEAMNFPYGYPYVSPYDSNFDSYGTLRLTVTDPPQQFTPPLVISEVKDFLRIDDDTTQDNRLNLMISAAVEQAEICQNRDLMRKQWDLYYDYWPAYRIRLRAPCVSIDLVQYKDLAGAITPMQVNADYVFDLSKEPAIITPPWNRSWPAFTPFPSSAILVRFTSGYSIDDPFWMSSGARVKMGMLQLISAWYEHRVPFERSSNLNELPFGITSNLEYGALERTK